MKNKRIGTIIHGALGDCYEQLCAIKMLKERQPDTKWVGFFAVDSRLDAMRHFELDMLEEIYPANKISGVSVDCFYQFQINDPELRLNVIDKIPDSLRRKFDFRHNHKPWDIIKKHNFNKRALGLELSSIGKEYLPICMQNNQIEHKVFKTRMTIGYLWRYRNNGGAIKPYFQRPKEWIIRTKSELFRELIDKYNAHIIVAGMNKNGENPPQVPEDVLKMAGFRSGEYRSKFEEAKLDIPDARCTYLKGIGYAAEMEIMSWCDLLLTMPSGFSEPLWMRKKSPVIIIDPPLDYLIKLRWNRMPFFNNNTFAYRNYNFFMRHTSKNIMGFLKRENLLVKTGSHAK